MADGEAVIIIKKIKKGGHGHHGGAWKVAYADFVTAMMAFFLLMWLLNATTEVQKKGISDYFSPVAVSTTSGGAGGLLGGRAISSPGAAASRTSVPSVSLKLEPTTGASAGDADSQPFRRKDGYSNWELSSDRAQASRRVLVDVGLDPERIASVEGRASRDPLLPDDTRSQRNRRISILLLKRKAEGGTTPAASQSTAPSGAETKPAGVPATPSEPPLRKDWTGPRVR